MTGTALSPGAGASVGNVAEAIKLFGYESLSKDQDKLIGTSIAGTDVLGVLPTGGGKSACYQIPAVVTRSKMLVISPLIALQEDQVTALRKLGLKAFALHSGISDAKKAAARYYFQTAHDEPSFLYLSPELLMTQLFHERFDGAKFDRLAVDEAHCVSTWGNSFRPDYQRIRLATMRMKIPHCSAFTATVDRRIALDIKKRIPLRPGFLKVEANPMRPNLILRTMKTPGRPGVRGRGLQKLRKLIELLKTPEYFGTAIIYCSSKDGAADLYDSLRFSNALLNAGRTPYLFHAALPQEDKEETLRGFHDDQYPLVVATTAFGMGIDRSDVRQIVHYQTPFSMIDYAQQIGRGGRDGSPTLCTTFHDTDDYLTTELNRMVFNVPDYDFVESIYDRLTRRLLRLDRAQRKTYNVQMFMRQTKHMVENSETVKRKDAYLRKMQIAMALLQKAGVIHESGDGLAVHGINPGSAMQIKLLELTEMHKRMETREKERVARFFGQTPLPGEPLSQELLWQILREN